MPAYTTVLGLYKAGGGSTGQITPDEPVDIDKINGNFDLLDKAVGLGYWSTPTRPGQPFVGQIGLNTTLDTYERWNGTAWVVALPKYLQAAGLTSNYFTQQQLTGGALDNRYFTQTQLLTGGKLDSAYYSKNGIKFDHGTVTVHTYANGVSFDGTAVVNFATKFTTDPHIALGVRSANRTEMHAGIQSSSPTGCVIYYERADTTDTAVNWIAIGT
jgi:hypothetical protein